MGDWQLELGALHLDDPSSPRLAAARASAAALRLRFTETEVVVTTDDGERRAAWRVEPIDPRRLVVASQTADGTSSRVRVTVDGLDRIRTSDEQETATLSWRRVSR